MEEKFTSTVTPLVRCTSTSPLDDSPEPMVFNQGKQLSAILKEITQHEELILPRKRVCATTSHRKSRSASGIPNPSKNRMSEAPASAKGNVRSRNQFTAVDIEHKNPLDLNRFQGTMSVVFGALRVPSEEKGRSPSPSGKRTPGDFSEDEWINRGNFYGEQSVLQCDIFFQSPIKTGGYTDDALGDNIIPGVLTITNYQLFFESEKNPFLDKHICIPVSQVAKISTKKTKGGSGQEAVQMEIVTRDFRWYKFLFTTDKQQSRITKITPGRVVKMLQNMCFPNKEKWLFAFNYGEGREKFLEHVQYNARKEFERMGIGEDDGYRFSNINEKYKFSQSYPKVLVFPKDITDHVIHSCGMFRRRARVPVLTWKRKGKYPAMFRSSQPQIGMLANSSKADARLLQSIRDTNKGSSTLYIFDCRPWKNAVANKVGGAGFESTGVYKDFSTVEFLDIENIHVMIKSRSKLGAAISLNKKNLEVDNFDLYWLQNLAASGWMIHLRLILRGSMSIIQKLEEEKCSVLVHCSDGWDRTAQVCSIAQLCLDSHNRTTDGFITLIQKDWLDFGHNFHIRGGFGKPDDQNGKRSPIFEQFLDAVYQLLVQYPTAFEFTSSFLLGILKQYFSCRFGTFLYNSSMMRENPDKEGKNLAAKTGCVWTYLKHHHINRHRFQNAFYRKTEEILNPKYNMKTLRFWNEYYLEHTPENFTTGVLNSIQDESPQEAMEDVLKETQKDLEETRDNLERALGRVKQMEDELRERKQQCNKELTPKLEDLDVLIVKQELSLSESGDSLRSQSIKRRKAIVNKEIRSAYLGVEKADQKPIELSPLNLVAVSPDEEPLALDLSL